jgi:hypothetical protein
MKQNEDGKKLIGIYLPIKLIMRLKVFIFEQFTKKSISKSQSDIIEDALTDYLDNNEGKDAG